MSWARNPRRESKDVHTNITDRDETLRQGLQLYGEALYLAVIADDHFDTERP
jgi:hypothetical protein